MRRFLLGKETSKNCERGHGSASSEMVNDQIWSLESVTHASLIAQAPPIRQERKRKPKKHLVKR